MKISVITVCLNSRKYIPKTIESVLSQDHPDMEYIIVDGGSTDGTVELIESYATADDRIVWSSEPDEGISDAMNKGVSKSSGDVIAHLNSDDFYSHDCVLSRVEQCFSSNPEIAWLTAGFDFVSDSGDFLRSIKVRRYSYRRLLRGNIILHPSTFIRRDLFEEVGGFDTSLHYCMDYDLFLKLGARSSPCLVDEQLSCFRAHADSHSVSQSEKAYAEEFQVRMKYLEDLGRAKWYYILDYNVKKRLNKIFYRNLLSG